MNHIIVVACQQAEQKAIEDAKLVRGRLLTKQQTNPHQWEICERLMERAYRNIGRETIYKVADYV